MSSFFEWTASVDWRLAVTWASGVLVLVNIVFLLFTIGCEDGESEVRKGEEEILRMEERTRELLELIRSAESRWDELAARLDENDRLQAELERRHIRMKTIKELSRVADECQVRLDAIEVRTKAIDKAYRKVEIMSSFYDAMDRDGLWDPMKEDYEGDEDA